MLLAVSLLLLPFAQSTSVLATMSDAQLCEVITRNMAQTSQYSTPVVQVSSTADCRTKLINASVVVAQEGQAFSAFVTNYLSLSRAGVCNMEDDTMRAFANHGWRFRYVFRGQAGEQEDYTLTC